jgi:hypothetical protein
MAHYNKGNVNRVVLDHISTCKLNLSTAGMHCINIKMWMAANCTTKRNIQPLSSINLQEGKEAVVPSSVSAAFQEVH